MSMNIVTDLLDKRVAVSLWIGGAMTPIVTGRVRAIGTGVAEVGFDILVETEIVHRGERSIGALSAYHLSSRGGCEITVLTESAAYRAYLKIRDQLHHELRPAELAARERELAGLYGQLSQIERDVLEGARP